MHLFDEDGERSLECTCAGALMGVNAGLQSLCERSRGNSRGLRAQHTECDREVGTRARHRLSGNVRVRKGDCQGDVPPPWLSAVWVSLRSQWRVSIEGYIGCGHERCLSKLPGQTGGAEEHSA